MADLALVTLPSGRQIYLPTDSVISATGILDQLSTTQGAVLYRGASAWLALGPGTAGHLLSTGGSGVDPSWAAAGGAVWSPILDDKPGAADTPDDEFTAGTLDAKWTLVSGASGTVDPLYDLSSGNIAIYDLATRPGWFLIQVARNTTTNQLVEIRQDYTIPDGKSIVIALAPGSTDYAGNNVYGIGIAVNSTDSGHTAGTYARLYLDAQTAGGYRWRYFDGATIGDGVTTGLHPGKLQYLRLCRDGLVYTALASVDGSAWVTLASKTFGTAPDNLWIMGQAVTDANGLTGIHAIDWIRLGGIGLDPW